MQRRNLSPSGARRKLPRAGHGSTPLDRAGRAHARVGQAGHPLGRLGRATLVAAALTAVLAAPLCAGQIASATASTLTDAPATLAAPGGPGITSTWTSGDKLGLGTSFAADPSTSKSHVWYTLGPGKMTEVFYPTADSPQTRDLQYVVTDNSGYTSVEETDTTQQVVLSDSQALEYTQIDTAKNGSYRITKKYVTDPDRSTMLIATHFEQLTGTTPLHLYALYNPSLGNADADIASTVGHTLVASGGGVASALTSSLQFTTTTSGYSGDATDGFSQLTTSHKLTGVYDSATTPGNIVQTAEVPVGRDTTFMLSLGFGASTAEAQLNSNASILAGFTDRETAYVGGWHSWFTTLKAAPASVAGTPKLLTQYDVALMTLRAHEDKTHPGAFVASLSTPWGEVRTGNAPGYHAVWARDLYNTATALNAAGDTPAAVRALNYILGTQERSDGSIPHNSTVNGAGIAGLDGLQYDEIADPAILADQLGITDAATWAKVELSADYLVAHGVSTPQERWEEQGGYSPATIAAEIAGLVSAADIATKNGDTARATSYLATADNWQASVESWTVTHTGDISTAHYERINHNGTPDENQILTDSNGWLKLDARDEIDPSFLELTRLGVKPANDAVIGASVGVVDSVLKSDTPAGPMWHRYSEDGYGEKADGTPFNNSDPGTIGRAWPVLTGERGEYELANGNVANAQTDLAAMAASANAAYMIPEQVWDTTSIPGFTDGQATNSAAPLAWADAQYVRLALSISAPRAAGTPANVETPKIVADRYANQVNVTLTENASTSWGDTVYVVGASAALGSWKTDKAIRLSSATYPNWSVRVSLPAGSAIEYKFFTKAADGSIHWQLPGNTTHTLPAGGDVTYTGTF
ncbi:glycoside hydrolase family 15 protein [Subtercola lobariae]|uniref:alpha-amylase n=1 Tax=Subtercola lobariae TaxID=1588641 RepID=A0A917B9J7_9MICO|nr:glycoside hydrolase family 15 protein [Subtercola lobariae]GGF29859.1 glucan 1,4-alpha-glucosidase [Subtercola lobariae]